MRVAITQPNFLPWLGYFELLDRVDVWVSLDNVQRSKQSFATRNRIKLKTGEPKWLSVRLEASPLDTTLAEARLSAGDWPARLLASVADNYRQAPYAGEPLGELAGLLEPTAETATLSRYNERIIEALARRLGITMQVLRASDLVPVLEGSPQDKVLRLLEHVDADEFYNFQRGVEMGLYDAGAFSARGIALFKQTYRHPSYAQLGGAFVPFLSVLDLLLNEGPRALTVIREGRSWERMIPAL